MNFKLWIGPQDQLAHDLLHPRGPRFAVGSNEHIVRSELELVPDGGVKVMVFKLSLFDGVLHFVFFLCELAVLRACCFASLLFRELSGSANACTTTVRIQVSILFVEFKIEFVAALYNSAAT